MLNHAAVRTEDTWEAEIERNRRIFFFPCRISSASSSNTPSSPRKDEEAKERRAQQSGGQGTRTSHQTLLERSDA